MNHLEQEGTVLIQARLSSQRLPGKVLLPFTQNMSMLEFLLERFQTSSSLRVVVLTSTEPEDQKIVEVVKERGVEVFRGPLLDVQKRFLDAADHLNLKDFCRVTADNPFTDPELVKEAFKIHLGSGADYTSTKAGSGYPPGSDVEVVNTRALKIAREIERSNYSIEHVTPAFYLGAPGAFVSKPLSRPMDFLSRSSITVDTEIELRQMREVGEALGEKSIFASWKDAASMKNQLFKI